MNLPHVNFVILDMVVVLLSICLIALAFAGIAIKIILKKDGKFAGTCSSNNPLFRNDGSACSICGARPEEQCKN